MSTNAGTPKGQPEKLLTKKNGRPLTIWDMHAGSGLSLRQHVFWLGITWVASGVAGFVYWWVRSIQKHGEINEYDIAQLPHLGGMFLLFAIILVYVYWRNVVPAARRDLAKLQHDAKSPDTHSSTIPPKD